MAKELLAVLVTDNNGEALYNYTGTGSGQTTFVAESGDLISNSLTINDINTTLTVTADKNILSYADNDSCTITATYEGETIEGQTVVFKNEETVLATKTTNSNGVATYEYESQGIGDITITVECMNLQETYSLEDCTYYKTTQYTTSSVTLNIPLPSHFSLEYVIKQTNSNYSLPYMDIGASSNNRMLVGQYARTGTNGLITYLSTNTNYPYSSNPTFNQENIVHFTYDGTDYTYWLNSLTPMTVSDKGVTLSKLIHIESGDGGYLKNIKIKPL